MKKIFTLLVCAAIMGVNAQTVIWTENFNNGCSANCTAVGYTGTNGAWSQTITGAEGTDPNPWYVSCAENNTGVGNCSAGCGSNQTLHIGSAATSMGDVGAAYDAGGLCGFLTCPQTDRRIESPVINLTGQSSVTLNFAYIETGDGTNDNCTVWYFDGSSWSMLVDEPATDNTSCSGQGKWANFSFALPASANNNPSVKIGFRWVNNDDGTGTDPSVAIDDITLTIPSVSPTITTGTLSPSGAYCAGVNISVPYTITGTFNAGNIFTAELSDGTGSFAAPTTIGSVSSTSAGSISCTIPSATATGMGYMIRVVSSNPAVTGTSSSAFTINALPVPVASNTGPYCAGNTIVLNCTSVGNDYDWTGPNSYVASNTQSPSIVNSIQAMSGAYTVTVTTTQGCTATATTSVSVIDCSGISEEQMANISVYPNPTNDMITISIHETMINESVIRIINMVGEVVSVINPNQAKTSISTKSLGLRGGIYLVSVDYMDQSKVMRLIIQ